jgi:hypothetical protein
MTAIVGSQAVEFYPNLAAEVFAVKGLGSEIKEMWHLLVSGNLANRDFKSGQAVAHINSLVGSIEESPIIRPLDRAQKDFTTVLNVRGISVELRSEDGVVEGEVNYHPPNSPNPDYDRGHVYAGFKFNTDDHEFQREYDEFRGILKGWADHTFFR